jgi:CoA-transferase family III
MRSAYLSDTGDDRAKLDELLRETDVFFSNRHPGHLEQVGLTADKVAAGHRGLIHAQVLLHSDEGPWATRPGFDEIGACVSGMFAFGGTLEDPRQPPMLPIVDNIVGWLGTVGVLEALRRRGRLVPRPGLTHPRLSLADLLGDLRQGLRYHHSGEHSGTLGHPARAVHREDPTRHLPGNDRSNRILFTSAGIHHHCAAADGRRSTGMVAASNKSGLIRSNGRRHRRRHRPPPARLMALSSACRVTGPTAGLVGSARARPRCVSL